VGIRTERRPEEVGAEVEGRERDAVKAAKRQAAALMARRAESE
jgi:hypothetical protein